MPKPFLHRDDSRLESEVIDTMLAGLKQWRPDLSYPESHSDMQGCVRALLSVFKVERRPLPVPLRIQCHSCEGLGKFIQDTPSIRNITTCSLCGGKGWRPGEV